MCVCVWAECHAYFQVIRVSPMSEREGLSREDTCSDSVTSGCGDFNYFNLFNMWNFGHGVSDFVNFI